jgi:hypothetical protein
MNSGTTAAGFQGFRAALAMCELQKGELNDQASARGGTWPRICRSDDW